MACEKKSTRLERCGNITTSNCVKYVGEENDCIELCSNISLSDVIELLSDHICTLEDEVDISELDVPTCFNITTVNIVNVLQDLLNKSCDLQSQIDSINDSITNFNPILTLELGCLSDNPCFNIGVHLNEAINLLIQEICNLRSQVADQQILIDNQEGEITSLQDQINATNTTLDCLNTKFNNLNAYLNNTVYPAIPVANYTPIC